MQLEQASKYICLTSTETLELSPIISWEIYVKALRYLPVMRAPITICEYLDNESNKRTRQNRNQPQNKLADISGLVNEENYWDKLSREVDSN